MESRGRGRKEGLLSGTWEFSWCSSTVSLNRNYFYVFKDLIAGRENLFGKVPNLYLCLSLDMQEIPE